jgi:hypothetical protein
VYTINLLLLRLPFATAVLMLVTALIGALSASLMSDQSAGRSLEQDALALGHTSLCLCIPICVAMNGRRHLISAKFVNMMKI